MSAASAPNRLSVYAQQAEPTPSHQAVIGGHEAVVRLLVDRGARLGLRSLGATD